jgi:hypothetical protein
MPHRQELQESQPLYIGVNLYNEASERYFIVLITVFSVICYSTWTQLGTTQMTASKNVRTRELPHEAATVGPW